MADQHFGNAHADIRLAWSLLQENRPQDAEPILTSRCQASPQDVDAWFLMGVTRHLLGRIESAVKAFDKVLVLQPGHIQALSALASMQAILGQLDAAAASLRQALQLAPDDPTLHCNLAIILAEQGQAENSLTEYQAALALQPDHTDAMINRGVLLCQLQQIEAALENNRQLAVSHPDLPVSHFNLAESLILAQDYQAALAAAEQALRLDPGHALAMVDKGLAEAALGHLKLSSKSMARARQMDSDIAAVFARHRGLPPHPLPLPEEIFLQSGYQRLQQCDWSERDTYLAFFERQLGAELPVDLDTRAFVYHSQSLPVRPETRLRLASHTARKITAGTAPLPAAPLTTERQQRPVRIGYISPDFHDHPVGLATQALFALHDREPFRIHGYSLVRFPDSAAYQANRQGCDAWTALDGMTDIEAATRIRADGIDILVDLAVYTDNARPGILALRPAPLQVAYHGLPGSSGAEFIDYKLTDRVATPAGCESHWSEKLVFLPATANPYNNQLPIADAELQRRDFGLPEAGFVFCAFHAGYKIDPCVFSLWMQLLNGLPDSVLWLSQSTPMSQDRLRREAHRAGIDSQRLVFADYQPEHSLHLARYRLADLFLDCFSFNAITTAADALWAGLPVLTMPGDHFAARMGASIVQAAGLNGLVCANRKEYYQQALHLAQHPTELRVLRERLRQQRDTLYLFDTPAQVRNLETAYLKMWQRYKQGLEAADIKL